MQHITKPTLLLDKEKCLQNLRNMLDFTHSNNLQLVPHVKTHQSTTIGKWHRSMGVEAITVSSLDMAEKFVDAGWRDITWAFPVNIREIHAINALAQRSSLTLFVNGLTSARFLADHLITPVRCYVEIDTGYGRTGVAYDDIAYLEGLLAEFTESDLLQFRGFYTHAGHSYSARSKAEINAIHEDTRTKLIALKRYFESLHYNIELAIGDTPCCSVATNFDGIDTIHPGNFIFYDVMQAQIGSCQTSEIAILMVSPVVQVNDVRKMMVVHSGAVHLSKEFILNTEKVPVYGLVAKLTARGWSEPIAGAYVSSLSQEHGVISWAGDVLDAIEIGDIIGILPIHACLTANLMGSYLSLEGEWIS